MVKQQVRVSCESVMWVLVLVSVERRVASYSHGSGININGLGHISIGHIASDTSVNHPFTEFPSN